MASVATVEMVMNPPLIPTLNLVYNFAPMQIITLEMFDPDWGHICPQLFVLMAICLKGYIPKLLSPPKPWSQSGSPLDGSLAKKN